MKKTIPAFKTDEEAEHFVNTADLSEYDLAGQFVTFELRRKDKAISLRLPEQLLKEVRACADAAGIPYQRFMRLAIERAVDPRRRRSGGRRRSRDQAATSPSTS